MRGQGGRSTGVKKIAKLKFRMQSGVVSIFTKVQQEIDEVRTLEAVLTHAVVSRVVAILNKAI